MCLNRLISFCNFLCAKIPTHKKLVKGDRDEFTEKRLKCISRRMYSGEKSCLQLWVYSVRGSRERNSKSYKTQKQPHSTNTTWGKVESDRQKHLNLSTARSQWFNDLSTAGEWSHSNILLWLALCSPLRVWLTWFWLVWVPASPSDWQDPGGCPHAWFDPAKDLWNQDRWGRRITYWARKGRDVTAYVFWWNAGSRGRTSRAVNVTNDAVENRFRKKLLYLEKNLNS